MTSWATSATKTKPINIIRPRRNATEEGGRFYCDSSGNEDAKVDSMSILVGIGMLGVDWHVSGNWHVRG